MFDYSHAEAAAMLGIAEDACRQRVHRAKARLREGRPRFQCGRRSQQRMLRALRRCHGSSPRWTHCARCSPRTPIHIADGGGLVRATLHPLHGAERLARLYLQIARNLAGHAPRYELTVLNGAPALLIWTGTR